jgi:membrane protease YdiL (CAAX protease family)
MKRLRRRLPPIVLSRTIFAAVLLAVLLAYAIGNARGLVAWAVFASTIGFLYILVNPLFDLGYQVEFNDSVIRQRDRGYGWLIGRQPWTEVSLGTIKTFKYLEPTQSIYAESGERPVELTSHNEGRTRRIRLEPVAFNAADFGDLISLLERSR